MIPVVDLKAQYAAIKPEVDAAIQRVLEHTQFIQGPEVRLFEEAFARFVGAQAAIGVASGTAALHLALLACGIGPGDEVITTPFTFYATAEAINQAGATPVFVDIAPDTYNLDPAKIEAAITPRTRAIVPVHLYGQSADMDAILAIARRHGLRVIEDAAQAHAAEHHGRRCGSLGDLACFSFYPSKNLGCYGDGGMVTGSDPALLARIRRLRDHGRVGKYEHVELGLGLAAGCPPGGDPGRQAAASRRVDRTAPGGCGALQRPVVRRRSRRTGRAALQPARLLLLRDPHAAAGWPGRAPGGSRASTPSCITRSPCTCNRPTGRWVWGRAHSRSPRRPRSKCFPCRCSRRLHRNSSSGWPGRCGVLWADGRRTKDE